MKEPQWEGGKGKRAGLKGKEIEEEGYREGYSPPKPLTIKHSQLKADI